MAGGTLGPACTASHICQRNPGVLVSLRVGDQHEAHCGFAVLGAGMPKALSQRW